MGKAAPTRSRQPRKAALAKKRYKELSDSSTEREEESVHLTKKDILKERVSCNLLCSIINYFRFC